MLDGFVNEEINREIPEFSSFSYSSHEFEDDIDIEAT